MSRGGAYATAVQYLWKGKENSSSLTKVAASQIYLYKSKHEKSFTEAARAVGQDPNDPEAQVAMGLAMITTGRPEAGLEFVETALRLSPSHPNHYVLAHAMAYFSMNDMEQSAIVLAAALERDPGAVELAPLLAASYARLGRDHGQLRVAQGSSRGSAAQQLAIEALHHERGGVVVDAPESR